LEPTVAQVTIENPILNAPFAAPTRHFRFDDDGITNDIVEKGRRSAYFVPIARPKKRGAQRSFETEWTGDRVQENSEINRIRERIDAWRTGGYIGVTATTRRLLEYWADPHRDKKLFLPARSCRDSCVPG